MISSQKKDGQFTFNMHLNPILSLVVDNSWRKDSFRDINIYIPESAKTGLGLDSNQNQEVFSKFPSDKTKQWNDISMFELLGVFSDIREIERKDK